MKLRVFTIFVPELAEYFLCSELPENYKIKGNELLMPMFRTGLSTNNVIQSVKNVNRSRKEIIDFYHNVHATSRKDNGLFDYYFDDIIVSKFSRDYRVIDELYIEVDENLKPTNIIDGEMQVIHIDKSEERKQSLLESLYEEYLSIEDNIREIDADFLFEIV